MTIAHFHDTQPAGNYSFQFEVELREVRDFLVKLDV